MAAVWVDETDGFQVGLKETSTMKNGAYLGWGE